MATMTLEHMVEQLKQALGDKLKSVLLYGSAAAGDFVDGASNFNLLVVIDPLGISELDAIGSSVAAWTQAGNPTPLLFTSAQLTASFDAFPIEMSDIRQSRRVLWGQDVAATIEVRPADLRLQLEMELSGKLLALRGRYALSRNKPDVVAELMLRSLPTFLVLFRGALRLYQEGVPDKKLEALRELAKHIPFDPEPFERLFEFRQKPVQTRGGLSGVTFERYLTAIEQIVSMVDRAKPQEANRT